MRKLIACGLLLGLIFAPAGALADKKTKKYEKQVVTIEEAAPVETPKPVTIVDAATQLYGEWTVVKLRKRDIATPNRAYIYLDFNGNRLYGNNGCNTINGVFTLQGSSMGFDKLIASNEKCSNASTERAVMRALDEVRAYDVTSLYNMWYLNLKNGKGQVIMTLRRQNLDFLNGSWRVKEMGGSNVASKDLKLVIDVEMLTINALTKCNIINGVVTVDPSQEMDVEFEDLKSSHNQCDDIDTETQMLINLEETASCKKINDNEVALLNRDGTIVMVLAPRSARWAIGRIGSVQAAKCGSLPSLLVIVLNFRHVGTRSKDTESGWTIAQPLSVLIAIILLFVHALISILDNCCQALMPSSPPSYSSRSPSSSSLNDSSP